MKNFAFAVTLLSTLATVCGYAINYEDLDVNRLQIDDHLLERYSDCLLPDSDIAYNVEAKELNSVIPDAPQTYCSQFNEKQKFQTENLLLSFLINNVPDIRQRQSHDAEL